MKRALFLILLLSVAPGFGCPAPKSANPSTVKDTATKSVELVVYDDGGKKVAVAPKLLKISRSKQKLRFSAVNNLDEDITRIEVDFGADNPFEGSFVINGLLSGEHDSSQQQKAKGAAPYKKYDYTIRVYIGSSPAPIEIDPQIEIVN